MSVEEKSAIDPLRLAPCADASEMGESGHLVQFYEDDAFLLDAVSRFIGVGLEAGGGAVVIATKPHLAGIEERLSARGLDLAAGRERGQYIPVDAAETLSTFMVGGWPDERRFAEVVGGILARAARGRRAGVRMFGEMVALLWADGNEKAAIRVEELWNDLGGRRSFSLLCAYPMRGFGRAADARPFLEICAEHARVIPAESYTALPTPDERLRVITDLQQKANVLEAEIAQRKEIEQALRRRDAELSDFLENGVEGLHRLGPDGTVLWANKAELDLLGYAPDEYIGHHIAEFHVDRAVIDEILEKLRRGESLHDSPARLRCKDGSIKDVLINGNARWENGEFVHTRCFTRDVTERHRAERERAELLAREQAARAQAEAASRSKDEFLATLSHELRTPLTAVLGWVRLLRSGRLDASTSAHALEVLDRNTQAQVRLIEDLLEVSRIITGKLRLDIRQVDLGAVIRAALEAVRPAAEAKGIRLESAFDPSAGPVTGDPHRWQQIVWNLLSNAVKYTRRGGRVEVRLDRVDSQARITVKDTGVGIAADFLPYVFERFSQAGRGPARPHAGLGLGLAIVRHLVELHGGTVHAESPGEGQGATFTVNLPVAAVDEEKGRLQPAPPISPDGCPVAHRPALDEVRVLVVDDNGDARELLSTILEQCGAEVCAVGSVGEALEVLARVKPDVLVSDIGLSGESGYDLIRAVRRLDGERGGIPAVALTAYAHAKDRERALSAGYQMHVSKPVEPAVLAGVVAKLAGRTATPRPHPLADAARS